MNDAQRRSLKRAEKIRKAAPDDKFALQLDAITEEFQERSERIRLAKELGVKVEPMSYTLTKENWRFILFVNAVIIIGYPLIKNLNRWSGFSLPKTIEWLAIAIAVGVVVSLVIYFSILLSRSAKETLGNKIPTLEELGQIQLKNAIGAKDWATESQLQTALGDGISGLHIGSGLYWNGQGHMMTVGGSRGGKGVNLILPALLADNLQASNAPSFVVLDPKGENLAVSGNYLKNAGYNVLAVNPFDIPEIVTFGNARFNPFDLFSGNDPDFDKYADMIAYALIPAANHANDYFDKSSRNYITLYIRHMMTQNEEPKNFRTLYKWLRLAGSERTALLMKMAKNDAFDGDIKDEATAIFGQLVNDGGKTVENIYSTVRTATDVFKDMQLRNSVSASDIDLKTIAHQKTAIFVCLSPADLDRCQTWLRLFFGSVMRGLTKHYNPARKVVMVMDEFPTLGALKEFEVASGFLAGYNVTLWPIMQDLTQLKNLYPNSWETFVNNAIVRHFLAVGDNFTADYLSKRMPKNVQFFKNPADDASPREIQKPLLEPAEVMSFPNIILEIKGMDSPGRLEKKPYWTINSNASKNPFRVE
ncbi:type IV secretory system conjugative DNA transfer family protein [Runella zeae]|uniref:type IV secretory system conjugative DNA transfer family protein n=1 Tax=Runella zeae TaxID=94255 RepID=UPI0003F74379|nr:type IV secretory system conjugative DNA transfer family protein [Runella zeae]